MKKLKLAFILAASLVLFNFFLPEGDIVPGNQTVSKTTGPACQIRFLSPRRDAPHDGYFRTGQT